MTETFTCVGCERVYKRKIWNQTRCTACQDKHKAQTIKSYWDSDKATATRDRFLVFSRDSFRCIYCGQSSIEDGVKLNADHIIPVKHAGTDRLDNLVTACSNCNRSKQALMLAPDELVRIQETVRQRNRAIGESDARLIKFAAR